MVKGLTVRSAVQEYPRKVKRDELGALIDIIRQPDDERSEDLRLANEQEFYNPLAV